MREMFHLSQSHVSGVSPAHFLSYFLWRLAGTGTKRETEIRAEARSRCIIVSSHLRSNRRARQRGDETKPTLGPEKVRWSVAWQGQVAIYSDQIPKDRHDLMDAPRSVITYYAG